MTRTRIGLWLALSTAVSAGRTTAQAPQAAQTRPNIVLINADDLGYGDLGCYGATHIRTPNIDRLAEEGRRFTDAHSASAVCSPSRYGLLTGRYPLRRNLWGPVSLRQPLVIEPDTMTLGDVLRKAGYKTACIGKWHLGFGDTKPVRWNSALRPGPLERGFDSYFGVPSVNSGPPFVYVEDHHVVGLDPQDPLVYGKLSTTKRYPEKGGYKAIGGAEEAHRQYVDDQVATTLGDRAVAWLRRQNEDQPFFLYLATTNIHHPFTPAPQFIGTSDCGLYGDFVHELDALVGRVLDALEAMDAADDTLVIFTSDNGGMFHVTGQKSWRAGHRMNGELLGFKFGAWEGGHRVPLLARWPGEIPAGSESDALLSHIDLFATFASIAQQRVPAGQGIDSIDQLSSLTGPSESPARTTLVLCPNSPRHLALRRRNWVYIPARGGGGFQGKKPGTHLFSDQFTLPFTERENSDFVDGKLRSDAPEAQLYDLANDPHQTSNVIRQHPEVATELADSLATYRAAIPKSPRLGWINLEQR